jgi:hypothetical protein
LADLIAGLGGPDPIQIFGFQPEKVKNTATQQPQQPQQHSGTNAKTQKF